MESTSLGAIDELIHSLQKFTFDALTQGQTGRPVLDGDRGGPGQPRVAG